MYPIQASFETDLDLLLLLFFFSSHHFLLIYATKDHIFKNLTYCLCIFGWFFHLTILPFFYFFFPRFSSNQTDL